MPRPRKPDYHSDGWEIELFGGRVCPKCGEKFAANTDYFPPDKEVSSGIRTVCRNCRRKDDRRRYHARRMQARDVP